MAKLTKEQREKISIAMKKAHAEKKRAGAQWKRANAYGRSQKKAPTRPKPSGGLTVVLRLIDEKIERLQEIRRSLTGGLL